MLELYEQNRAAQSQPSHGNEAEGSSASVPNQRVSVKAQGNSEEPPAHGYHQASKQSNLQHSTSTGAPIHGVEHSNPDKQIGSQKMIQNDIGDHGSNKTRSSQSGSRVDAGTKDSLHNDKKSLPGNQYSRSSYESDHPMEEQKPFPSHGSSNETGDGTLNKNDGPSVSSSMMDAMNKIDKDKVKAALEKRRKSKGDVVRKVDVMDDDDLLERELEHGVELAVEDEKIKQERRQNWSHGSMHREDHQNADQVTENGHHSKQNVPETDEEGEFPMDSKEQHSPQFTKRNDGFVHKSQQYHHAPKHREGHDDAQLTGRHERGDRDYKRPRSEG